MAASVTSVSFEKILALLLFVSLLGVPQGRAPGAPGPKRLGASLLQTTSSVKTVTLESDSIVVSGKEAPRTEVLEPGSAWIYMAQFVIGSLVTPLFLKLFSGKSDKGHGAKTRTLQKEAAKSHGLCQETLADAARSGDVQLTHRLLRRGVKVDSEDSWASWGCTSLHVAAHCKHVSVARVLLEHGADVNAREAWDEVPLHFAARSGSVEMCELLLSYGAHINSMNADDVTPLLAGTRAGHAVVCQVLLARGGVAGDVPEELPPLLRQRCLVPSPAS